MLLFSNVLWYYKTYKTTGEKAMKKRLLTLLVCLTAIFVLLTAAAYADEPDMDLAPSDCTGTVLPDGQEPAYIEEQTEPEEAAPAEEVTYEPEAQEEEPAEPEVVKTYSVFDHFVSPKLAEINDYTQRIEKDFKEAALSSLLRQIIPGYGVAADQKSIDTEVKQHYTKEEATQEINVIIKQYSDTCEVSFGGASVDIKDSYLVDSRYDRQKVSTIIHNTGLTQRSTISLAAEWKFHNVAYDLNIMRASAKDANLDYVSDPRWYVNTVTDFLATLKWI